MHELKENIRMIFDETDEWLEGLFKLGIWLSKAKKYFPVSQKTILRWIDEILASSEKIKIWRFVTWLSEKCISYRPMRNC